MRNPKLLLAGTMATLLSAAAFRSLPEGSAGGDETVAGQTGAQSYEGKTPAQWIEALSSSAAVSERSKAAEVLGFMAREESQTYGGFSDVPIDSPEPLKLTDEELGPIVAALIAGLSDAQPSVRASSAIALSWIGPRASAAVPALIARIDDANGDARTSVLTALGRIGASANAAIPKLRAQLKQDGGKEQTKVAEALRLVGDDPSHFIPTLIARLPRDHRAAIELALVGDPAVPALLKAFKDKDPDTRKYAAYCIANMAGWEKLTKNKEEVVEALLDLAKDENPGAVYHAAQALGNIRVDAQRCVPVLVGLLKHKDSGVVREAAESLREFASAARPALPALVDLLAREEQQRNAAYAIREIGIDRASAEAIGKLKLAKGGLWLLIPLLKYPDAALEFVRNNPQAVDVPARDRDELIRLLRHPEPSLKPIQEALYQNEQLPLPIMAELGDSRFLPLIKRRLETASGHDKPRLAACARACGAPLGRAVQIDASRPGDFKPKSAWPDVDASRMAADSHGHGDGFTEVIITGQMLRSDGAPVDKPAFFRMNDAMLLGEQTREEEPITYDPKTGRFVYITLVFAAYSHGSNSRRGQKWPEIGLSRRSCSRIGLLHGRALRANVPRSAYLSSSAVSEGRNFSQVGERSRPRASYHAMSTQERPQALVR